jgi:hypothetical protein
MGEHTSNERDQRFVFDSGSGEVISKFCALGTAQRIW